MSFFLILTVAIMAGAAVLIVRRRSQRAASRSGRYRSPRAGLNLERPAGLPNRSRPRPRPEGGSQSNSLAGPVFLALVVVVMVFWVVAAFILPEGETRAAMVSETRADASPPEQFSTLAGRLSSEPANADGRSVMAQAASASVPALPPSVAPAGGSLMVAAQSMAPTGNSHLAQVGLQASRAAAGSSAKSAQAKPAGQARAAQAPPPQPNRSAAAPRNTAPAAVQAAPVMPTPPAAGSRSSVVSAASASSAPRAAASGAMAPAKPSRAGDAATRSNRAVPDEAILASSREFTVHLGSFTDQDNAEKYKSKLDGAGEWAFISQVTMEGRLWFRVMSGRFNNRAAAEAHGKDLKRRGLTVDPGRYLIKSLD